jgi:hypothetical protein
MATIYEALNDDHRTFIAKQLMFFVATTAPDARVNLSPKGMDCFRVLGPNQVGYLDLGGSGNETHAHLAADGRITFMFCAFDAPARILRIYGKGRSILPQDAEWTGLSPHFAPLPGARQIFIIEVGSVQTSCGWGVPKMNFPRERQTLVKFHRGLRRGEWMERANDHVASIDGLPIRVQTELADWADS